MSQQQPMLAYSAGASITPVTVTIGAVHGGEFPFAGVWESGGDGWSSGTNTTTGPTGTITPPAATYAGHPILVVGDVTGFGFGSNPTSPIVIVGFPIGALGQSGFSKIVVTKAGGSPLTLLSADATFQADPIQGEVSTWSWHVADPTLYFADGVDSVVEFFP